MDKVDGESRAEKVGTAHQGSSEFRYRRSQAGGAPYTALCGVEVVILAGGLATRLGTITRGSPKSMVGVGGRPFLEHQIEMLRTSGVTDIILCTGHLGEQVQGYFGDGSEFGVNIRYSHESRLLGTAGALKNAKDLLNDPFFTLYGDSFLFLDFKAIMSYFLRQNKLALMTVFKNYDRYNPSNTVVEGKMVKKYSKKERTRDMVYVEYGANILRKEVLELVPNETPYGLDDLFPRLIEMGELLAYEVDQRFYEIGSPESLKEFQEFITGGTV